MGKNHQKYPTRMPVWWARYGSENSSIVVSGVSGRRIVIRILKQTPEAKGIRRLYNLLEELMFRMTKGPRILRRPLDEMNSLLWELCDGSREFLEICEIMDGVFKEEIAPVNERTNAALLQFESLGFLKTLDCPFDGSWPIGPGISPPGQKIPDTDPSFALDTNAYFEGGQNISEEE